jgi:hypothetical protein
MGFNHNHWQLCTSLQRKAELDTGKQSRGADHSDKLHLLNTWSARVKDNLDQDALLTPQAIQKTYYHRRHGR